MARNFRFRLAGRIVETTIRELSGHFRKGKRLKRFYRSIRNGEARAFVTLRDHPEEFVGLLFDSAGPHLRFELWLSIDQLDEGTAWSACMYERHRIPGVQYVYRTPKNPRALAQSMGLIKGEPEPTENDSEYDDGVPEMT